MSALYIVLTIIVALASLAIIPAILLQKKRDAGFSGSVGGMGAGGGGTAEKAHFDKTKKRTLEGRLERGTKALAVVFMVLSLVIALMA